MSKVPGVIRRRGAGWNVMLRVDGRRYEYGPRKVPLLRYGSRKEVEEWAWTEYRKLVRQMKAGTGSAGTITFSGLVGLFREQVMPGLAPGGRRSYENSFVPLEMFFVDVKDDPLIEHIRAGTIREYLAWRRTHPVPRRTKDGRERPAAGTVSAHTVARDYRVLKRLFRYAVKTEYLEADPVAKVEAPRTDPRTPHILTADEYERLLDACDGREMLGLYVLVLGETGGRAYSEALMLRWEDVDLNEGFIHFRSGRGGHRTKSGKSRWVPMTTRLAEAMRAHFARYRLMTYHGERTPCVFHHTRDRQRVKAGKRIRSMRRAFASALERAKLPAIRPHDLRHRRVTTWLAEGKPAALVQEAMGHSTITTTLGYSHLSRQHLRALVDEPARETNSKKA